MSPIIDCFDGKIVSWEIGEVPNSKLVNDMLKNAISQLKEMKLLYFIQTEDVIIDGKSG